MIDIKEYLKQTKTVLLTQDAFDELKQRASAQSDRDIPIKPAEETETYWGRCVRAAVCPKCDYHLGRVYFLSDGHDIGVRKISYCETCGQAIDWSEWEDEDEQTD